MFIVPITRMDGVSALEDINAKAKSQGSLKAGQPVFQDMLKEAVRNAEEETKATQEMDSMLATGQIDDLHSALIQAEQSAAAVEFTTQLASKAVNAYNQIMGMQI